MPSRPDDPSQDDDSSALTIAATLDEPFPSMRLASAPLLADRYELLGLLGSGGMGTVYRARDTELDEIVALKVLRKELASAPGMLERFRREVKLARRVTHPNVARMFDIGEHAGDRFLTMELIDGDMLATHLAKRGRLSTRSAAEIGRAVCAGLEAAHAAGVLHRDLKPENVIMSRTRGAVITDFGIARAVTQGEGGRTGNLIVGTPNYMAPEQVEGAADLDARADLYALGAMLYELTTGVLAWSGDSPLAVAAARLLKPPPDPSAVIADLPPAFVELVRGLMARSRDERPVSAAAVAESLAPFAVPEVPPSDPSLAPTSFAPRVTPLNAAAASKARSTLAVLPLVNLGPQDDDYLAVGLTEDLVDLLSVVPSLRVRPRGETARHNGPHRDAREIGRTLGVDVVVDGSVRRAGDDVRVSVRVVTVEDGFQLWARRFDRPAARVLAVAEDAAAAVAEALAAEVHTRRAPTVVDDRAQDLYLRGRHLLYRGTFGTFKEAVAMLRDAHERAPHDARIAGAYALSLARSVPTVPSSGSLAEEARRLATETLAVDPRQVQARVALGFVHLAASELTAAAIQLQHALDVSPQCVEAIELSGRLFTEAGDLDRGVGMLERALAVEPTISEARRAIARVHALRGDYDASDEALGEIPENPNDRLSALLLAARIAVWRGDPAVRKQLLSSLETLAMSQGARRAVEGFLTMSNGPLGAEHRAQLDAMLTVDGSYSKRRESFHAQLRAEINLAAGHHEEALAELETSDELGLVDVAWLDLCPLLRPLRDTPRFALVRANCGARARAVIEVFTPRPRGAG